MCLKIIIYIYIFVSTFKVAEININGKKIGFLVIFEQFHKLSLRNSIFDLYQVYKIRQDIIGSIVLVRLGNLQGILIQCWFN